MYQTLIRWRLREVMARYKIKAKDLAHELQQSPNSISNLRNSDTMPRLDGDSLNNLCNALNRLAPDASVEITPMTLIDYSRDPEPPKEQKLNTVIDAQKTEITNKSVQSNKSNMTNSVLAVSYTHLQPTRPSKSSRMPSSA